MRSGGVDMHKMQARRERVLERRYAPMYSEGRIVGWRTKKQIAEIMTYNTKHRFEYADRESAYWLEPAEGE